MLASLNAPCPKCGHQITPAEIKRVSWDEIECPKYGLQFDPVLPQLPQTRLNNLGVTSIRSREDDSAGKCFFYGVVWEWTATFAEV